MILTIEEKAAATLRVKIPEEDTETAPGKKTGKVDGRSSLANTTLDIINSNFFQQLKLLTNLL
jgi:hypothetical protein